MSINMYGIYEAAIKSGKLDQIQLEFCIKELLESPESCLRIIKISNTHRTEHTNLILLLNAILKNKKTRKVFIGSKTAIVYININVYDVIINQLNHEETIIFLDNVYTNKVYYLNLFTESYYQYLNEDKKNILDTYLTTKKIINSNSLSKND